MPRFYRYAAVAFCEGDLSAQITESIKCQKPVRRPMMADSAVAHYITEGSQESLSDRT